MSHIIIIGTGLAGYNLAREIRKHDKTVELTLVTEDDGTFYSKPMLSNALAKGKAPDELAMADVAKMRKDLDADIIVNTTVSGIDPDNKYIQLPGDKLQFDKLVLAVGARPFVAPIEGDGKDDILTINNLQDYRQFCSRLANKKSVAIIGPGLIGCEFANDLIESGFAVNVIGPDQAPLGRLLPASTGVALQHALQDKGVIWHLQTTAQRIDKMEQGYRLTLANGDKVFADIVISAIGLRADMSLASEAGLQCERGIVVDRQLMTSHNDIYALGDCAQVEGLVLPFILPIMQCARALAQTLTGSPTAVTYPPMPVVVKTPAYPIVISPPPSQANGEWHIEQTTDGCTALYKQNDQVLGFMLGGEAVSERQALTKLLPPLLN